MPTNDTPWCSYHLDPVLHTYSFMNLVKFSFETTVFISPGVTRISGSLWDAVLALTKLIIDCIQNPKAVNIFNYACRCEKSYACQMVPAFCRSAVIHAMPERSAKKCFRVDFISTAELAPAFAALPLASKWSNYRENAFLIGRVLLLW